MTKEIKKGYLLLQCNYTETTTGGYSIGSENKNFCHKVVFYKEAQKVEYLTKLINLLEQIEMEKGGNKDTPNDNNIAIIYSEAELNNNKITIKIQDTDITNNNIILIDNG